MDLPVTSPAAYRARRARLQEHVSDLCVVLAAGHAPPRNYAGNPYAFRGSSHFLFFGGPSVEGAAVVIDKGRSTLYCEAPDPDDALWHGARPTLDERAAAAGVDEARPIGELGAALREARNRAATIAPLDHVAAAALSTDLGRPVVAGSAAQIEAGSPDARLADAVITLRLAHDEAGVAQLRAAATASVAAHEAGMRATRAAKIEREVAAAMLGTLRARGMGDAYNPIVTVHGEVLHAHDHDGAVAAGDLLLCDVGGESPEGWAADITRTWPISGTYSSSQRAIYEVVLAAQLHAIDRVRPGVRYREVHDTAKRTLVAGLRDLGILRGEVDGLLERGAAALFFPHGVGHLIGLDVHDMEDLGDRAGYAPGRTRSKDFGDCFLRLDRDLAPGMAVTIEPGFYQVPAILNDPARAEQFKDALDRDVLARYADVRGIRIEDDVLCTTGDPEVLTGALAKRPEAVEALIAS